MACFAECQRHIGREDKQGPNPTGESQGGIQCDVGSQHRRQRNSGRGNDGALNGGHIAKTEGQKILSANAETAAEDEIVKLGFIREENLVMEEDEHDQGSQPEHEKQNGFRVVVKPAQVQVYDGKCCGYTRSKPPHVIEVHSDLAGRKDQPDACKGYHHHENRREIPLFSQENPGEYRNEHRKRHIEDIGLDNGGDIHGCIETIDGNAVGQGATHQQMIPARLDAFFFQAQDEADDDEPEEESDKDKKCRVQVDMGFRPPNRSGGQIEAESRYKDSQAAE